MEYTVETVLAASDHRTPSASQTLDQAHETMRLHRDCAVECCPRKAHAMRALIEAGRIVPDSARRH